MGVIVREIARAHRMDPRALTQRSTRGKLDEAHARHEAIYFVRRLTRLSFPRIGMIFTRDHTSIMHGNNRVAGLILNCPVHRACFDLIAEHLRARIEGERKVVSADELVRRGAQGDLFPMRDDRQ